MQFFKAFIVILAMGIALGVTILIMVKGDGLLSMVPFFAYLIGFTYIFAKYGCLVEEEH
jgi:hypothetical protein